MDEKITFDFDYWMNLFVENEEEFYRQRKAVIEEKIQQLKPDEPELQQRIRAQIHRINVELDNYKHPLVRLEHVKLMFWNQYNTFQECVLAPDNIVNTLKERKASPPKNVTPIQSSKKPKS